MQSELKSRHTVIKRMLCGFPTGRVRNAANGPPERQIHTGSTARQDVISNNQKPIRNQSEINPKSIRGLQNTEIRRFKKLRMTFPTEQAADLYPAALREWFQNHLLSVHRSAEAAEIRAEFEGCQYAGKSQFPIQRNCSDLTN